MSAIPLEYASYLSHRSVKGFPYVAIAWLKLQRSAKGYLYWHPVGPGETPGQVRGVPGSWVRDGTKRARELRASHARDPRPWEKYDYYRARLAALDTGGAS